MIYNTKQKKIRLREANSHKNTWGDIKCTGWLSSSGFTSNSGLVTVKRNEHLWYGHRVGYQFA
jgi:hypothetical protein